MYLPFFPFVSINLASTSKNAKLLERFYFCEFSNIFKKFQIFFDQTRTIKKIDEFYVKSNFIFTELKYSDFYKMLNIPIFMHGFSKKNLLKLQKIWKFKILKKLKKSKKKSN